MRGKGELSGKQRRHHLILALIRDNNVETQEDIVAYLRGQNIEVTQATVSRDIKELRLVKVMTQKGVYKYATVDTAQRGMDDRFARIFSESALGIDRANNLLVIRTINGAANAACEALDAMKWPGIIGTIAGDNNLLVIARDEQSAQEVVARFNQMVHV